MKQLLQNKRGDFTGILYLIVGIAGFAVLLLIAGYISTTVSTELKEKMGDSAEEVNQSFDTTINVANNTLSAVWYVFFGGLLIGLFITAWFMPTHPILVAPFIVLLVIAVILGVAFSNMYEKLYGVSQFSAIADTQTSINFMMSNLPYVALVIGILALIITFAKPGGNQTPVA